MNQNAPITMNTGEKALPGETLGLLRAKHAAAL